MNHSDLFSYGIAKITKSCTNIPYIIPHYTNYPHVIKMGWTNSETDGTNLDLGIQLGGIPLRLT